MIQSLDRQRAALGKLQPRRSREEQGPGAPHIQSELRRAPMPSSRGVDHIHHGCGLSAARSDRH